MHYNLRTLYKLYFSDGNLANELSNAQMEIEYPDGSRYKGTLAESKNYELVLSTGEYKKKSKNNNSYFKTYKGAFNDGVPHGEASLMQMRTSEWPKGHPYMRIAEKRKCCSRVQTD
jgi:hypothetical protein